MTHAPRNSLISSVPDTTISWLGRALFTHSTNQPVAIATGLGIRNEVLLRRAFALPMRVGPKTRWRSTADQRRWRELADAEQFHEGLEVRPGAKRPAVNWHEGGTGPALLLLNGFTASGLVWPESWLRKLETRYRVIRIDNRGTGWSRSAQAPFTIADLADDARDVLRFCWVDRATVLGFSMGGMIAQELASRHPEVVDALVLVATRPPTPAAIASDRDAFLRLLKQPPRGGELGEFFTATWGATTGDMSGSGHRDEIAELGAQILRRVTPRSGVLNQARAMWSWRNPSRLRRVAAPTTVVHGNRDPLMPAGNGMRLASLIRDATYAELPGVGHLVPQEAGDELMRVLDA